MSESSLDSNRHSLERKSILSPTRKTIMNTAESRPSLKLGGLLNSPEKRRLLLDN